MIDVRTRKAPVVSYLPSLFSCSAHCRLAAREELLIERYCPSDYMDAGLQRSYTKHPMRRESVRLLHLQRADVGGVCVIAKMRVDIPEVFLIEACPGRFLRP
ncbi:hypothetical protein D3C78_1565140 [compost metagenome]